jgi:hypothetical protein
MRLPAMAAWFGATLLLAGACTTLSDLGADDPSNDLAWDVSGGHSLDDVEWPNDLTAFHLGGGVDVDLTLPAGRHFDDHVAAVVSAPNGQRSWPWCSFGQGPPDPEAGGHLHTSSDGRRAGTPAADQICYLR